MSVESKKPYVFISYAHRDAHTVLPIIEKMREQGVELWYDNGIEAGSEWPEYIAEKIQKCDRFICFISKAYLDSQNCRRELNFVISEKKELLSVFIEDTELSAGMRMQLGTNQSMFMNRFNDTDHFVDTLCAESFILPCKSDVTPRRTRGSSDPAPEKTVTPDVSDDDDLFLENPAPKRSASKRANARKRPKKTVRLSPRAAVISLAVLAVFTVIDIFILLGFGGAEYKYRYAFTVALWLVGISTILELFPFSLASHHTKPRRAVVFLVSRTCVLLIAHLCCLLIACIPVMYEFLAFIAMAVAWIVTELINLFLCAIILE